MNKRLKRHLVDKSSSLQRQQPSSSASTQSVAPRPLDASDPISLTPQNIIQLQSVVGNQAVQRMIQEHQTAGTIQRGFWDDLGSAVGSVASTIAKPFISIWDAVADLVGVDESEVKKKTTASKAKILTEEEAKEERQRALDQARFTEEELKEIGAHGVATLLRELTSKSKELKKSEAELKKTAKSLKSLQSKLTKARAKLAKKPGDEKITEQIADVEQQIADLHVKHGELVAQSSELSARIAFLKEIKRKQGYKDAMAEMESELGGKDKLEAWFANFDPNATFLGLKVRESDQSNVAGIHKELVERLQLAEAHLMALPEFAGKSKLEVASELGIYRVSGLRQPKLATDGDKISLHCYGLAVDINAASNPYVGRAGKTQVSKGVFTSNAGEVVKRAARLLGRTERDIMTLPSRKAGEMWDFLDEASDAMRDYFALRSNETALKAAVERAKAAGDSRSVAEWKKIIEDDYGYLHNKGDFGHADPAEGFMDLKKQLVVALVDVGGLSWGGTYQTAKDIQHFDWRKGSITRR